MNKISYQDHERNYRAMSVISTQYFFDGVWLADVIRQYFSHQSKWYKTHAAAGVTGSHGMHTLLMQ